jgi:sulfotransferase family protein
VPADDASNGSGDGVTEAQQRRPATRTLAPPDAAKQAPVESEGFDDLLDTVTVRVCPNPVFVIGAPRSGTSVLPWSLSHHWDFSTSQETEFLHGIFDQADAVYRDALKETGTFITEHNVSFAEFFSSLGLGANALISSRSKGKRWIDQTPGYTTMAWVLASMFPGASFIHVLRDGRAVVNSMIHFGERPGAPPSSRALPGWATDFKTAVETWTHYVEFALDFCARNADRTLTVKNEDLVERTDQEFQRIFAFLGAPHNAAAAQFFRTSRVNSSFEPLVWGSGKKGRKPPAKAPSAAPEEAWRDWTAEQRATFTDIAGDLMKSVGYPELDI